MAQKKKPVDDPLRAKAAQMRLAQERADRRTRIIVISAVATVVLAVVAAVPRTAGRWFPAPVRCAPRSCGAER